MGIENLKNLIESKNLFPIVPLKNYKNIPIVKWSLKENRINNPSEFKSKNLNHYTGFSLLTGKVSEILVIDIDKNHGDGSVDGEVTFRELINELSKEDKNTINNTFKVKTPNGGIHLYFKYKEGLKNKADYFKGIDIRTDGGIITLPYTQRRLSDGEIKEYKLLKNLEIKDMPQALFNKFLEVNKPKIKEKSNENKQININNKYYKKIKEGEGRDSNLISWLGFIIKNNPTLRTKEALLPHANMYNQCYFDPPLDLQIVESKVESVLKYALPSYCDERGNINNWALVQHILKNKPSYTKGNLWFIYNEKQGFYEHMELKEVQKMYFKYAINDKDKTVNKSKYFAELLMLNSENAKNTYDEKNYINCLNGVIDINNDKILNHNSKYKLQVQFKANYIESWKDKFNKSNFKKFLETTLDKEDIITMKQAFGLFLSPHAREVEKVFLFKGSGSNGKSVMFDIMESLIDKKYIGGIGLGDFGQDFIVSMLEGKHVNIVRDDDFERTIHKHFKSISTGEEVAVNRKNKDIVRLAFNNTMFFGLNGLPNSKDKSFGFFRRPIIIQFDNTFGTKQEVDQGKAKYIKNTTISRSIIDNELDIVFNWAYEGLQEVRQNNWNITQSEKSIEEMEEYREDTDTVYSFYKNNILKMVGNKVKAKQLYEDYLEFCKNNYIETPVTMTTFGKQIKSFGIVQKRDNHGKYYLNITTELQMVDENNPFNK